MKSQAWIELLITFAIFIIFIIYILSNVSSYLYSYYNNLFKISTFQRLYLASFYFSYIKDTNIVNSILNITYSYSISPTVVYLKNEIPSNTSNKVYIFYDETRRLISIVKNSSVNTTTNISAFFYSKNNIDPRISIDAYNANVKCSTFNYTIYTLGYSSYLGCDIIIYQNGYVNISNVENIIIIKLYNSMLPLYHGNKILFQRYISTFTDFISFFVYVNDSISKVSIYV